MGNLFDYAVVYKIEAISKTPLRTGNQNNDVEEILRYKDGTAFIQGNSISGACRNWLEENQYEKEADILFGNEEREGHLIISDGVFEEKAVCESRPGIAIDEHTGTVGAKKKFDTLHIVSGQKMNFKIVWLGKDNEKEQMQQVEKMLSAMHTGNIRLGAKKTNGFGQFALKVCKREYDLKKQADREEWLSNQYTGKEIELLPVQEKARMEFVLTGKADAVLVKAAAPKHSEKDSCIRNIMEGKAAVIPGSSIKGAVRARVKAIVSLLGIQESIVEEMFGSSVDTQAEPRAGQVYFEDMIVDREKKEKITRIRIDRFTGGVMRKGLFTEEPLSTDVKIRIIAEDKPEYGMLLLYALRDLAAGLYNIGSNGAIGRGYFTVDRIHITDGKGRKAALVFDKEANSICEGEEEILKEWSEALEERL